jgi:hypothetical protein
MIRNVHERTIEAPAERVGRLIDRLGGPEDELWPRPKWTPLRLDRPIQVGADGGHGSIRYAVTEYEPGRRVRFVFHPETGIEGWHEFAVEPLDERRCRVRHVLLGRPRGIAMRILVPLAVVHLHDALLEDLFDNAERAATGTVRAPAGWSPWVRFCWRLVEVPDLRRDAELHRTRDTSGSGAAVR